MRVLAVALILSAAAAAAARPPMTAAALHAAPARAGDQATDDRRHGPDLIAFAQVRPGEKVVDLIPGGGYFTRLLSTAVGAGGKVYAVWPEQYAKEAGDEPARTAALPAAGWRNVVALRQPAEAFATPAKVDLIFTAQNLHDYADRFMAPASIDGYAKQAFAALRPGGRLVVIDHVATAGSGLSDTDKGHRIDPAEARRLIEAAGFEFDGESGLLRNPADDHRLTVFDKAIRGHTDQFVYRFRKPAR